MATFTGHITTANGLVVPVSGTAQIAAAASTVFGVTPDTSGGLATFSPDLSLFSGDTFVRAYGATTCPQWTDHYVAPYPAGTGFAFSAKTPSIAEYISNWDAMPSGTTKHRYTFFHEANRPASKGAPDPVAWKPFMSQLIAARNVHPNRDRILIGPNFSWYPAVHHNEGTSWASFMTDATGKSYHYDFISWDQYAQDSTAPDDPATFVSLPKTSGQSWKLPVEIWETGIGSGGNDTAAAAWLLAVAAQYRAIGVTRVAYWNSGSYKLNTRPHSLAAWKSLL